MPNIIIAKIDNHNKCRHVSDEFNKDLAFFACLHAMQILSKFKISVARSNFVKIPMKAQKIPRFRVFSQKIPRSTFIPRPLTSEPISPWSIYIYIQSCQVQMIKNLDSFRIVPDHFQKKFFRTKLISATSPPRRQKIFGQCTILGVKKNFPDL